MDRNKLVKQILINKIRILDGPMTINDDEAIEYMPFLNMSQLFLNFRLSKEVADRFKEHISKETSKEVFDILFEFFYGESINEFDAKLTKHNKLEIVKGQFKVSLVLSGKTVMLGVYNSKNGINRFFHNLKLYEKETILRNINESFFNMKLQEND